MYDIIPDIHGQSEKLKQALTNLGYENRNGAWRHSDPKRICVFLGDFVDRGPNNAEVIDIVRRMVDAGTAFAIKGNHELNAIHFHTNHPTKGAPLRPHSEKNIRQHASFLSEFPLGDNKTADVLTWMKSLPLYLEFDDFRVVHACWNESVIGKLQVATDGGVLSENQFIEAATQP
jgi:predicted MPP superfamily phosphohydrolase